MICDYELIRLPLRMKWERNNGHFQVVEIRNIYLSLLLEHNLYETYITQTNTYTNTHTVHT